MNKIAEVTFAYSPKCDDELELNVGDKIEVIGVEEEGWWRGKLNGRIGLFPSNFVRETGASAPLSSIHQQHTATSNKLNSIFGSKLGAKNSPSSNSLNTINNTSNNSSNSNFNSNSNNIPSMMNNNINSLMSDGTNASDAQHQNETHDETNNESFSERKPKPIRGIGYGDIFAAGATKPKQSQSIEAAKAAVGSIVASERLSNSLIGGTLQKPMPKKPPPPTPVGGSSHLGRVAQNGSANASSDKAPALPPKPSNQSFSSFMQQSRLLPQQSAALPMQRSHIKEQARVIHAYEPTNDDELELKVNDVINIIDKKSEDHGWWKGELNGKVGVFPDNFVQLITVQEQSPSQSNLNFINNQSEWPLNRIGSTTTSTTPASNAFSPPQPHSITNTETRAKSVFSSTPKGFSKELESNLERQNNNPASYLSLKSNKISSITCATNESSSMAPNNMTYMLHSSKVEATPSSSTQNGHPSIQDVDSSTKLTHITANRTTGPTRRPPSNVLNKRNRATVDDPVGTSSSLKKDAPSNDSSREEQQSIVSSPVAAAAVVTAVKNPISTTTTTTNSNSSTPPSASVTPSSIKANNSPLMRPPAVEMVSVTHLNECLAKYDNLYKQISTDVTNGLNDLRKDVEQIHKELGGIKDLKEAINSIRAETEHQRKFIKELVNNLADERKKIASLQVELDRCVI